MQKHIRLKAESGSTEGYLYTCGNCEKPVEKEMPELEMEIAGTGKSCLKIHKIDRKKHSNAIKKYIYYNIFSDLFGFMAYATYLCRIISLYQEVSLNNRRMKNDREKTFKYPFIIRKRINYY